MQHAAQCPNCGKFYPDFVTRLPLHQSKTGHQVAPNVRAWGSLLGVGMLLTLLASGLLLVRALTLGGISFTLIDAGYIGGGALVLLAVIGIVVTSAYTATGYQYHCKSCGKDWQVLLARTRLKPPSL